MRATSVASQVGRIYRSLIEVERKFKFDAKTRENFCANVGMPKFKDLRKLGHSQFEDTYFDHDNVLTSKGIWVRKRDGKWEAKVRINHQTVPLETSSVNSQFQELSDPVDIARVVHSIFPLDNTTESTLALSPSTRFGPSPMARFITYREAGEVDGKFNVVFDTTDFGHTVGEVELEEPAVFV